MLNPLLNLKKKFQWKKRYGNPLTNFVAQLSLPSTSMLFSAFSSLNLQVINLKHRERLSLRNMVKSSSTMLLSIQRTMFSSSPKIAVGPISLNTQSKMILLLK